jgi:hypothetical protein
MGSMRSRKKVSPSDATTASGRKKKAASFMEKKNSLSSGGGIVAAYRRGEQKLNKPGFVSYEETFFPQMPVHSTVGKKPPIPRSAPRAFPPTAVARGIPEGVHRTTEFLEGGLIPSSAV